MSAEIAPGEFFAGADTVGMDVGDAEAGGNGGARGEVAAGFSDGGRETSGEDCAEFCAKAWELIVMSAAASTKLKRAKTRNADIVLHPFYGAPGVRTISVPRVAAQSEELRINPSSLPHIH